MNNFLLAFLGTGQCTPAHAFMEMLTYIGLFILGIAVIYTSHRISNSYKPSGRKKAEVFWLLVTGSFMTYGIVAYGSILSACSG